MKPRNLIQLVLVLGLVAAGIRLGLIYYERHAPSAPVSHPQPTALDPDYYVTPKKTYAYDLKTARADLVGHPAWVREGYKLTYYPYQQGHADFQHPAGLLGPLERLEIGDVVQTAPPAKGELSQVVAVFAKGGRQFAVPIGARSGGDYTFYANDMFFLQDPHELYRHWKPEVWQAVERHQVEPGMNEIQASFAVGMGVPQPASGDSSEKKVVYPNAGHEITVLYRNGKAADIRAASPAR